MTIKSTNSTIFIFDIRTVLIEVNQLSSITTMLLSLSADHNVIKMNGSSNVMKFETLQAKNKKRKVNN